MPDIIVGFSDMEQNKKLILWSHSTHGLILIHKYKKNHFLFVQLIRSLFVHSVIYFIISGNDAIHQLANGRNSSLLVTITPIKGGFVSFKMYHQFYVFGEDQNYRLQLANPGNGNLGTSNSNIFILNITFTDI